MSLAAPSTSMLLDYTIDAWHPRAAAAAVQAGSATLIMDTDHPNPSIDLEELVPDLFVD